MLLSLKIENIAIIESADIEFDSGLNVLTGETGAGKSIIIDSINAVLGERTSRELIRTGAQSASVTALFSGVSADTAARLKEYDIEPDEDGNILLRRTLGLDGKNTCRINGVPSNVAALRQAGHELINIHGQHNNQALMAPEKHFEFIDCVADDAELLEEYREKFRELCSYIRERDSLKTDESEKLRRLDLLDYQINELEQADIRPGERDELNERKTLLQNCERVTASLRAAYDILQGADDSFGVISAIGDCAGNAEDAARFYKDVESAAKTLRNVGYELEDCAGELRSAIEDFSYDPSELEEIEARLDELFRLSVKYGSTEDEMLSFLDSAREERNKIALSDERVKVNREKTPFTINGADNIEFLISANAGETLKPLAKIASGGELSRIMLAIKSVIAGRDGLDTMIFDEIDAGLSGRAAQKVAMKLKEVSRGRQVICVTHSAQIAAQADCHMRISKSVSDGKTYTKVERLDTEGRKYEIARITGGLDVTELQLKSAEEMLKNAGNL